MTDPRESPLVLSPQLRAAIARDISPVRPLAAPAVRAAWLAPIGLLLLVASAAYFGMRPDARRLGWLLTWGASAAEMILGLALIASSLREAIPGTTLSRRALAAAYASALAWVVGITLVTWASSGIYHIRPGREWFIGRICFAGTLASAVPPLLVAAWLVARAYPLRPAIAGLLYGIGAGLLADAGWRLYCHFSDPAHVFSAHIAAVAASALIGSQLATFLARRR